MAGSFAKIKQETAAELVVHFSLSREAVAVLDLAVPPRVALETLMAAGCLADAIHLLAFGLPKREAVWWASLCVRHTLPQPPPVPGETRLLESAEAWVWKPGEETRRQAMAVVESVGFDWPSSWCAVGAFWSGGSLSPVGQSDVPPAESLTSKAVVAAILLAAARDDPSLAVERLNQFLAFGIHIADGHDGRLAS